jgi:hypothetical protein
LAEPQYWYDPAAAAGPTNPFIQEIQRNRGHRRAEPRVMGAAKHMTKLSSLRRIVQLLREQRPFLITETVPLSIGLRKRFLTLRRSQCAGAVEMVAA